MLSPQSGGTTAAILPRDRNVGGVDIDTVITPFGSIGMMVLDSNILGSNDAFIVDMAYVSLSSQTFLVKELYS